MTGERIKVKAVAFSTNEFLVQSIVGITLTERSIDFVFNVYTYVYISLYWSKLLKTKL